MTSAEPIPTPPPRRRVGRPSKLNRERIVEAAYEIGFEDLTMQAVADRLGVSLPGLYHYVRSKDDLVRLAAEFSAGRMQLPKDHGQHWAVWLYEWGLYNRDAFVAEPGLLKQFIDGAIGADRAAANLDSALGTLVKQGFVIREARRVYGLVSEMAIGAAVGITRERRAAADGRPSLAEFQRVLAQHEPDGLPHLRAMIADATAHPVSSFHDDLVTLLHGIAVERGEKWPSIATKLKRFKEDPDG